MSLENEIVEQMTGHLKEKNPCSSNFTEEKISI